MPLFQQRSNVRRSARRNNPYTAAQRATHEVINNDGVELSKLSDLLTRVDGLGPTSLPATKSIMIGCGIYRVVDGKMVINPNATPDEKRNLVRYLGHVLGDVKRKMRR